MAMTHEAIVGSPQVPDRKASGVDGLHFGHFSDIPEYREVNRALVQELVAHLPNPFVHVDLATGAGLVPQLLIEAAEARGYTGRVYGIDLEPKSIELARATTPPSSLVSVEFIEGDARDACRLLADEVPPGSADSLSIHDAIHEIPLKDQPKVLQAMYRLAKKGALVSLNSAFTDIALKVGSSLRGHGEWKIYFAKLTGGKRNREEEAFKYRTPEEYKEEIVKAGFKIIKDSQETVNLSRKALKYIGMYPTFIEGFCKGIVFPRKFTLQELSEAIGQAVDQLRFDGLPRVWYNIIAQKPKAA